MARKNHHFGITLKSELSKAETFEEFQKSIDLAVLNDAGVFLVACDFDKSSGKLTPKDEGPKEENEKPESKNKILAFTSSILKKTPGLVAFLKKYKWWQIYIGMAAVILILQFAWNLLH